jgi:outer membrane lipoprotein-sorting protein
VKALSVKQTELVVVKYLSAKSATQFFKTLYLASCIFCAFSVTTSAAPSALSNTDRTEITRVEKYLNELLTLKSRFLQATSTGDFSEGTFYLSRPGKMRIVFY